MAASDTLDRRITIQALGGLLLIAAIIFMYARTGTAYAAGCDFPNARVSCTYYSVTPNGNLSVMLQQHTGTTLSNVAISCIGASNQSALTALASSIHADANLPYVYLFNLSWMDNSPVYLQDLPCYGTSGFAQLSGLQVGAPLYGYIYINYSTTAGNFGTSMAFVTSVVGSANLTQALSHP